MKLQERVQKAVHQPQKGLWTNWHYALKKSLTWNEIWHIAPLWISFLIRSVYDLLPSNTNLVWWAKKEDPTCLLCQGRQTAEHVLNSCKIALSHGQYTWRHNTVLQEFAAIISMAKGETTLPKTNTLIFTTEGGTKSWHRWLVRTTNQIKCLLQL